MLYERIQFEPEETITEETRRHWFIFSLQLFSLILAAIVPVVVYLMIRQLSDNSEFAVDQFMDSNLPELLFLYTLWLTGLWVTTFSLWTDYYLDVMTITDRRLILVNQKGFFRRNVASFRLERLQDINVEINGLIPTLLDFGTIHAETAGHSDEEFRAANLPHPRDLKAKILSAADSLIGQKTTRIDQTL